MIEDLFEPYNCDVRLAGNAALIFYQIVSSKPAINEMIRWTPHQSFENALQMNIHKLIAVLSNGVKLNRDQTYDQQSLLGFIDDHYIKLTPSTKLDTVLDYINQQSSYEGEIIELHFPESIELAKMYFTNLEEWNFYFNSAISQGLIKRWEKEFPSQLYETEYTYGLTVEGLTRIIKISEGNRSNQCFIAMAFVDDMFEVLGSAIKPALSLCGFKEYLVNEQQLESDTTINDGILAGIKRSRFTIADFTYHRGGVYFEAGYALGRGQKVIYTCRQDQMDQTHFDVRNYQHIVWTDAADLKEKLINKIEAFIKD